MLSTKYNPAEVEDKWYQHWLNKGFFHSEPSDKEPYTIVIPPPNVTGVLHMGHMLNNTIQDVLVRKARMEGKEACWVPGTDHASIATEAKVVAMLRERGIKKSDLTREEFLKYAWEWKEKYGGIILEQLKKLGASCDWERTRFTMEPDLSDAVINVFIDLHKKGYIYRGLRMVNWDPAGKTALSDDEVIHKEVQSRLYYIRYQIEGTSDFLTIATVRPETIMADSAICVNPSDTRYTHLKGKRAIIPLINRSIPIIEDDYVAVDFGTGCLKVTPAHDMNDYELGKKHNLEVIDILNEDGTLNNLAKICVGEDRFIARKKIAKELEEKGYVTKVEDYRNSVGFSERTDAVIEPRLSLQWFVKMEKITGPALENVMNDTIKLIPPKFKNTYNHWMSNVRDWCISRQLWWGQRIPAWYLPDVETKREPIVAKTKDEALESANRTRQKEVAAAKAGDTGNKDAKFTPYTLDDLKQDEDVLDTWFSSWLWPISVFDGFKNPDNPDIKYYYPTNDLVTAPEILFFWVARMIIAGYEYVTNDEVEHKKRLQENKLSICIPAKGIIKDTSKPFANVYLTGIVRDKQGRKMSKSLGNSPDPLDLIATFGADAVRTGMLFSAPAGNDLLYDDKLIEQGRNFANKIWNAFRLVNGWSVDSSFSLPTENKIAIEWFELKLSQSLIEVEDHFSKFRMSDALHAVYKLVWDDFCAWYLEMIKPEFTKPIDEVTYNKTIGFFETLLKVLHPFMPFITEELWHELNARGEKDCIIVATWPKIEIVLTPSENSSLTTFENVKLGISFIRQKRQEQGFKNAETSLIQIVNNGVEKSTIDDLKSVIEKLSYSKLVDEILSDTYVSYLNGLHWHIEKKNVDVAKERESLQKELLYQQGFIVSVNRKLENEKFMTSAPPQVIDVERKKKTDAETKIKSLEESLAKL